MHKFKYWFSVGKEDKEFIGTEKEFKRIFDEFASKQQFVRVTKKKLQRS